MEDPDFTIMGTGAFALLRAATRAAKTWAAHHLPEDMPMLCTSYVVPKDQIAYILTGIADGGMTFA